VRPFPAFRASILVLVAACASGCSKLAVEWSTGPDAIGVTARGFPGADLVILAGPPTGPHFVADAPAVWSTVGPETPDGKAGRVVAKTAFDEHGVARAVIPVKPFPKVATLLQPIALSRDAPPRPLGVGACMALSWDGARPVLRPHAVATLWSPDGAMLVAVAAIALAVVLARRTRVVAAPARAWRVALLLSCAAFLLAARALEPRADSPARRDRPPPLLPAAGPGSRPADPLDRVTKPGFRELLERTRASVGPTGSVRIVTATDAGLERYRAGQAAWLLWPRATDVAQARPGEPLPGVAYLSFEAPAPQSGVDVLFANEAGALWRAKAAAPR
jgi:hypothetical protein